MINIGILVLTKTYRIIKEYKNGGISEVAEDGTEAGFEDAD